MMKNRDVLLEEVQPRPQTNGNMVIKNPVRMIGTGSFSNIYRFLMELESKDRAVIIENMTIVRSENTKGCRMDLLASILQKKG